MKKANETICWKLKIINAADQLAAAGETAKLKDYIEPMINFLDQHGIVRKSAVGEAKHALARSFDDFLNPDRQLAINSIVSGHLNQFKKNLFDIPVKRYFDNIIILIQQKLEELS